jgi:predicted phage baseplate assembly protein
MSTSCGCCDGVNPITPEPLANRPGLDALRYRVGTHATFLESMIAALTLAGDPALEGLTTRTPDDATLALLDAWATVADVLTFYQERIANEGYLRTAVERRSILELGRLVGYELRPGVSANTYLAYTLEQNAEVEIPAGARAQSLPGPGELPQSFETAVPLKARAAWNYLEPRKTRPLVIVPKEQEALAGRIHAAAKVKDLYLEGTTPNLKPNDRVLLVFNPTEPVPRKVAYTELQPAANRTKVVLQSDDGRGQQDVWLRGLAADLPNVLDKLRQAPAARKESPAHVNRRVQDTFAPTADAGPNLIVAANPLLKDTFYRAWENANLSPLPKLLTVDPLRVKAPLFGHNAPLKPIVNQGVIEGSEEWPLADELTITVAFASPQVENAIAFGRQFLQVMLKRGSKSDRAAVPTDDDREQSATALGFAIRLSRPGGEFEHEVLISPIAPDPFGLKDTHRILVRRETLSTADGRSRRPVIRFRIQVGDRRDPDQNIEAGQSVGYHDGTRRVNAMASETSFAIVQNLRPEVSTEQRELEERILTLDTTYDQILPGSWVLIERLDAAGKLLLPHLIREVEDTATLTKTAFGITAKVTQLTLKTKWLEDEYLETHNHSLSVFRNTTVFAQNEPHKLAEEPIVDVVGDTAIELQSLHQGLESGRWLIVTGERADIQGTDGVMAQELVMLARIEQDLERVTTGGKVDALAGSRTRSTLFLTDPLAYSYKRDTVRIYANVVKATHGETRNEILGGGNGSEVFQRFTLKQPPLTYLAAPNAAGVASTLDVRVNEVTWHRVDALVDAGPRDRCYATETDDSGRTTIVFGDGIHGARLPTGLQNVTSIYRNGIGKGGNVKRDQITLLVTRPLGVKEVINPIAASGGADAETRDDARANVPLRLLALDRLVSVADYEAFTRAFAGIAKAKAERFSNGARQVVHLTIAGSDDIPVDETSDLQRHLRLALRDLGDPQQAIEVQPRELLFLVISATVALLPDYNWTDVERRLRAAMLDAFSFKRRQLGQDVVRSEVLSVMHGVTGVAFVDLDVLDGVSELTPVDELRNLSATLSLKERVGVKLARAHPEKGAAQLAILTPDVRDTLILRGPEK